MSLLLRRAALEADVSPEAVTGGWATFFRYEQEALRQRSRRRKFRDLLDDDEDVQDALDRQIAQLLHEQEAKDAEREESRRLLALAARYAVSEDVPERVRRAALAAQQKATQAAIDALGREIERARDEEEIAALLIILNQ